MRKFATRRNFCILAGVLLIAYALFGYFNDEILILGGSKGLGGPKYARGERALWAALGYVSIAVAALLFAKQGLLRPTRRPQNLKLSGRVIIGIVFFFIGLMLLGFMASGY